MVGEHRKVVCQPLLIPAGTSICAEESFTLIVVNAVYTLAIGSKVAHHFATDKTG
jgi:hypothetical protein